jgi:hypothetical protein
MSVDQKLRYANTCRQTASELAGVLTKLNELESVWNSRLYGPGAANEIINEEISLTNLKADDLYAFIILSSQIKTAVSGAQKATLDRVRGDI